MFTRIVKFIGLVSILSAPTVAEFGIPQKRGGSFEEQNEMAKQQMAGNGMADYANMDPDELMKMIEDTMADPAMKEYVDGLGAGMGDALNQLGKMSPEEIQEQMQANLKAMQSPDMLNQVLENKEQVLETLLAQGLLTEAQVEEFKNDPQKFQDTMGDAFDEMQKMFKDPDAMEAVTQVMKGVTDIMTDPAKAMQTISKALGEELGDDEKIEEARLQLLADPGSAGNPALASLFENEEMQEILKDPEKWREQVRKGQEMLGNMGASDDSTGAGAGVGEL